MRIKEKKAISLIVLVITIIVLSILAATVIVSISNTNVIEEANKTVFKTDLSNYKEVFEMYVTTQTMKDNSFDSSSLDGTYKDNEDTFNKIFGKVESKYQDGLAIQDGKLVYETEDETEKAIAKDLGMGAKVLEYISKDTTDGTSPYIGYFADTDGDGIVDGVIFADLAYSVSDKWRSSSFEYTALETSKLKNYVVSQESYTVMSGNTQLAYDTNPVLKATGSGEDRFYVMALSDVTVNVEGKDSNLFTWYAGIYPSQYGVTDYLTVAPSTFGSGKSNTNTMISKWNNIEYGAQNNFDGYLDMWGVIQDKVYGGKTQILDNVKWFVPSKDEWAAFLCYLATKKTEPLTDSNYASRYGLCATDAWTSTFSGTHVAFRTMLIDNSFISATVDCAFALRLATTF